MDNIPLPADNVVVSKYKQYWQTIMRRRATVAFVIGGLFMAFILIAPPLYFPSDRIIRISEGQSIGEVGQYLKDKRVISSPIIFKIVNYLIPGENVIAGNYIFRRPYTVLGVVWRITHGEYDIDTVKITIPEGATVDDISIIIAKRLTGFNRLNFLALTDDLEGYLFPDTYFFQPGTPEEMIVDEMVENFYRKIQSLKPAIDGSGKSLSDIITMASIVEKEAITEESRRIVAGILWRRIDIGMRLQVDAVFPYIIGKNTFDLTLKDLRNPSKYNTYRYEGLPPGPIANPGLESIEATIRPIESPYLFYLSDYDSEMHYAVDYDEHIANKNLYLRR